MCEKGQLIGQGNTAEIYNWGTKYILKLYRKDLPDSLCQMEFDRTVIAYNTTKIAPQPMEIKHIDGRIGAVYEKINGNTMLKEILFKPWLSSKYARQLAVFHKEIQKPLDCELISVKEKLRRDIEDTDLLNETEKLYICRYLESLPDGNTLCHFDFHPDNIILSNRHYVIDWMTACKGDRLADVARTSIMLYFGHIPRVPDFVNYLMRTFKRSIFRNYLKEYLCISGDTIENVQIWELPVAAGRLREWIPPKEKQQLLAFVKQGLNDIMTQDVFYK